MHSLQSVVTQAMLAGLPLKQAGAFQQHQDAGKLSYGRLIPGNSLEGVEIESRSILQGKGRLTDPSA